MQTLPIKYFDTHAHGDVMSVYTNDVDTLRQMFSQSIPQVINSSMIILVTFVGMLFTNVLLTGVVLVCVVVMPCSSPASWPAAAAATSSASR